MHQKLTIFGQNIVALRKIPNDSSDCFKSFNNESIHKYSTLNDMSSIDSISNGIDFTKILPPEIIICILKKLSYRDLYNSVALVNKEWYNYSKDPTLLSLLHLSKETPIHCAHDIVEVRPLLKVLKMNGYEYINETIQHCLISCPFIYCLDIGFCEIYPEAILSLCLYGKNLIHLNIEGVDIDHEKIELICNYLPQLQSINLSHCANLTDQTLYSMSRKLNKIKCLNIDGIQNITDYGIINLSETHSNNLRKLWIDGCELSDLTLQGLTMCNFINLLSISYADSLTDDSIYPLRTMSHMKSLTIRKGTQLNKPALMDLFLPGESKLTNLTYLDLNECSVIDDEVLSNILEMCGKNLTVLSLHWCWNISDNGLKQMVQICTKMVRLSLIGNHIIKGYAFESLPHKWLKLTLLNLTNCNQIDDELLKRVAENMPNTYIFDYFGERFGEFAEDVTQYDISRHYEKIPICGD